LNRSGIHHPHLNSTISKFGVGALEAGFYLGDSVKVVSKGQGGDKVRRRRTRRVVVVVVVGVAGV